jgi:hypothetical protein
MTRENRGEREFETMADETAKASNLAETNHAADRQRAWFANEKRTYDEYQQESLESIKGNRRYVDKVLSDAQQNDNQRQAIANQALQNAVETANMVGKQAVRHGDIAIDGQWNPVQQGAGDTLTARAVSIDDTSLKAIGAAVAAALANSINPKK